MRILLVEDDRALGGAVATWLVRAGYAVDTALDGASARRLAAMNAYDAAVLDVMLPDTDGFALCRELRAAGHPVRIIMATARDAVEDRIAGLDQGADDYLVKPYALGELEARLRALLRRPADPAPVTLVVGDLALDTTTRVAMRGAAPHARAIALTAKEYAVLETLMRHPGEVLTRAHIAQHAWDDNFDPASNVIDVYMARLRRKVDADGDAPLLATIRGAGYRLGAPPAPRPR